MSLKIFISYAREDQKQALKYYDMLKTEGFSPWIDTKHILPGQKWQMEIDKAFHDANVILLLLSTRSVGKRGFVQKEANDAIEQLKYKLPTDIYVIPLLLETSCEVPSHIASKLQYIDLNTQGAWEQILSSLKLAAQQQSIKIAQGLNIGPFCVFTETLAEKWKGQPGYDISVQYPKLESSSHTKQAKELTLFFGGHAAKTLIELREKPWSQFPDLFPDPEKATAINGRWDTFKIAYANNKIFSLAYEVSWYGAGAMHANSHFETFNFLLSDKLLPIELSDFFVDRQKAFKHINQLCFDGLCHEYWKRYNKHPDQEQLEWFHKGCKNLNETSTPFTINSDCLTFLFSPYTVSYYAAGNWSVDISFYDLKNVLKPDGPHLLAGMTDY